MIRLHVACEGHTEQEVVERLIEPHLRARDVFVFATTVGTPRERTSRPLRKGGGAWKYWKGDLQRLLASREPNLRVTTMFDLYGLPRGFPGRDELGSIADTNRRCSELERALADEIGDQRFIPYLQRHELEALVLCAARELRRVLDAPEDLRGLDELLVEIEGLSPEEVDDGPESAPSKRLRHHVPGYRKALHGPQALGFAGLGAVRARCPRFDAWLTRLESLGT